MSIKLEGCVALIQVFDMPRSLAFYRGVLGFEVVQASGPLHDAGWVWLRHGDAEVMLNTMYEAGDRPDAPDPVRVAAPWTAPTRTSARRGSRCRRRSSATTG
jgi:catechol 2,3-dioxygenase-like lactoylglutathione lyase family enzyme